MSLIPRSSLMNLDNFFDDVFPSFRLLPETKQGVAHLAVDIKENDNSYVIKADFPGVKKEDIHITLENNVLTISAEHQEEEEEKKEGRVIRKERRYGKYSRSFTLNDSVRESDINAKFDNGVLTLDIPKSAKKEEVNRRIAIK